jgi:hypothetical protein
MSTTKRADETKAEIRECFRKWGVHRDDIEIYRYDGKYGHQGGRVEFRVNSNRQVLSCDNWFDYATNLRALYLALDATRKAAQRGILEQFAQAALAMLPEAKRRRPPQEILQVAEGASIEVAEAAYRALAKEMHPDAGGTEEAMKELNEAIETFRKEQGAQQ